MSLVAKLLILAVAAQILLAFGTLVLMGRERVPRVMGGEIAVADIAVEKTAWPLRARLLSNNLDNQFQLPVLFYVAALLTLWAGGPNWLEVALAWVFVALRYAHTVIHVTTNQVYRRFGVYTAGLAVLAVLWLMLLIRIITA